MLYLLDQLLICNANHTDFGLYARGTTPFTETRQKMYVVNIPRSAQKKFIFLFDLPYPCPDGTTSSKQPPPISCYLSIIAKHPSKIYHNWCRAPAYLNCLTTFLRMQKRAIRFSGCALYVIVIGRDSCQKHAICMRPDGSKTYLCGPRFVFRIE